ncbi:MAG: TetR/AcrR family transcriptional regulator [Rhizobium sp.]|nr:TetR/AcrR family transcriptional regulator [Rhizobium sp.]
MNNEKNVGKPVEDVSTRIRRKPERLTEILAAAFEEFVLHGYTATRLEDVAARAGVTKGTIYFHFQNKENVFVHMVHELTAPMKLKSEEFLREASEDGIEFLRAYLRFAHDRIFNDRHAREILRLMISESTRFPDLVDEHLGQFIEPVLSRISTSLATAAREGKVRNAPAIECPDVIMSPILALNIIVLIFADRKALDPQLHLAAAEDLLLNGLLPRDGDSPS